MIKTRETAFIFVYHDFHFIMLTDQVKVASETFALSRQMGEGGVLQNGLRDCHAVKLNFVPFVLVA